RFGPSELEVRSGWSVEYLLNPGRLYGANGIRAGADGRIYVAQLTGCRVSAIDIDSCEIEHLETVGGDIIGPDDLVFDDAGNLYVTEFTESRVSVREANGATRILQGDVIGANPITYHQGHLIAGECRHDARIMELDRNGGAPRIIVDHVPMTNAFEVGPDGKLYFPVMETNEIWRVNLDGSECEVVVGDLGVPDSVIFDSKGCIISTQVGRGQVLRIDPRSGERTLLADIGPGLDNSTFVGDRLFVSHMTGSIHEILAPGELRELNPKGLLWPMGVAAAADGSVYVADGSYAYVRPPGGKLGLVGMIFTPGYPGFHRGAAAAGNGEWFVTTSIGEVRRWNPASQDNELLASGYDKLMSIAVAPGGTLVFAESGTGRVLELDRGEISIAASGLDNPTGVAIGSDGKVYVSESGAGRVVRLRGGKAEAVIDGLKLPEGLAIRGSKLYVIDVTTRELVEADLDTGARRTIVSGLPVGAPSGPRKYLGPAGEFSGPMVSFAGLAAGEDGTLYVGADGNGSVMAIHPPIDRQ
ncbi:MAG: SMP-30/gluconolactonase/LRE family protein, partial [Azoarcus sp.]|nr:SMP-30/gluconolactonase/LRE family protein [Azoarcus sp.]